jgi:hypothetical protein
MVEWVVIEDCGLFVCLCMCAEGRRGVIPRGDGFEKVQIGASVCKVLLAAAVAARVVVAFASENLSNGSSSHEPHEHYAEGAHAAHHHTHEEHEHHHDHEQQCSHQHHHHRTEELNQVQRLVQRVSEVTGIATVADAWRDNLAVCCASTVLLLLGAVVPFIIPKQQSASSLQSLLVIPALPLTGVCTSRQEILARYSICWYDLLNSGNFAQLPHGKCHHEIDWVLNPSIFLGLFLLCSWLHLFGFLILNFFLCAFDFFKWL